MYIFGEVMFVDFGFLFCILVTNEVPEQPVISPLSGAIFERRIVEKYILENGCDPITGKELKVEDLLEIKSELLLLSVFYSLFDFHRIYFVVEIF